MKGILEMKEKVLFICESYYDNPSPNGICVQKIAEYLAKTGIKVNILTLFSNRYQDSIKEINGVTIYRVDPGWINRKIYIYKDSKKKITNIKKKIVYELSRINGLFHAFQYPLLSHKQINNLTNKAIELHNSHNYNHVVVVYQQIHPVLSGIKLKKNDPNIDLVLYTLDALSGGWIPNILHSKTIPMNSLKKWEKYIFNNVDRIFAMESHRKYYETNNYDKYFSKLFYLDIPLLSFDRNNCRKESKTKHLVFTGSMNTFTANPQYLLKILGDIDNIVVDIYGNINDEILDELRKSKFYNNKIFFYGKLNYKDIKNIQNNADILLNFGNSNPNMIPCKIFEYISTKNKIISFSHSLVDSSLPYMKRYSNALIIFEDDESITENIQKINEFIKIKRNEIENNHLEEIFKKNTPKYFKECLIHKNY